MDTDRTIRYAELIEGFSADQLQRLPLAIEVYPTLPELIGAMVSGEAAFESSLDTSTALQKLEALTDSMAKEGELKYAASILGTILPPYHRLQLRRLRERSEEFYSELVEEYYFLSASFELGSLIRSAYRSALLDSLNAPLRHAMESEVIRHGELIESSNALVMERLTGSFRSIDSKYELVAQSLLMS